MKLYEISDDYLARVQMLDEHLDSGQIDEQMYLDTLDSLDGEFTEKGLNIGKLIKTWEAEELALKDVQDTPHGRYAELRCKSHYFDNREAITFNTDGFIGFAGWADKTNIQPILEGFREWVAEMARGTQ